MERIVREIISEERIRARVAGLAEEIAADHAGRELILIGVLKGGFVFLADLIRLLPPGTRVDFARISSYKLGDTSGKLEFAMELGLPVAGESLLIVEDIVDTGKSMAFLRERLLGLGAKSVRLCALVDKTSRRETAVRVDYPGFVVEKGFLVGYGLDYAERYRGLPGICEIEVDSR